MKMPQQQICLLGSSGLLGGEFLEILKKENKKVFAPSSAELDLLDFEKIQNFMQNQKPTLIVHCVAYTQVDQAEAEKEKCHQLNVLALQNLLKLRIPIISFSTDYVFDGSKKSGFIESDIPNPVNEYGSSKAKAEKCLEQCDFPWWNIRTSWLFGKNGKNFVSTIFEKSKTTKHLKIVNDQIGRPTYAQDLAKFVVEHFIKKTQTSGHYHLQNSGPAIGWADFAEYFLSISNWKGTIEKISSPELNLPARRPEFSILKNTKLKHSLRDWQEGVKEFIRNK